MKQETARTKLVYVTRYALSTGIIRRRLKIVPNDPDRLWLTGWIIIKKPEWHETRAEAIQHAKELQKKKIASLKKQLKKIKSLTFEGADDITEWDR